MSVQTSYLTAFAAAYAGMLGDANPISTTNKVNSEASAEIPFGSGVKQGVADGAALLPAAQADDIIGVVLHSHAYERVTELGTTGLKVGVQMNLLTKGTVWLLVEEAVVAGDRGFCRRTAGVGEQLGAWRKSADSTDCVDCTKQVLFLTSAGIGGFALADVDFTNEPD